MIKSIIQKYVEKLTTNDIISFAKTNGVCLNNDELSIIYNTIKNDWYTIIFGDYQIILKKISPNLKSDTIKKIEELILLYKDKYKNYL